MQLRVSQSRPPDTSSLQCTSSEQGPAGPQAGVVRGGAEAATRWAAPKGKVAFLSPSWSLSVWGWEVSWGRQNVSPQLSLSLPRTAPALPALDPNIPASSLAQTWVPLATSSHSRWPQGVLETLEFENRQMQKVCCGVFPFPPPALSLLSAPRLPPAPLACILPGQQLSACLPARLSVCPLHPLQTPGLRPQHPRALLAQLSSNV